MQGHAELRSILCEILYIFIQIFQIFLYFFHASPKRAWYFVNETLFWDSQCIRNYYENNLDI